MKSLVKFPATAGLFCCLAATPALADVAAPDAATVGSDAVSASTLQVLDTLQLLDAAIGAASDPASAGASSLASQGPAAGPVTALGVDSSPSYAGGSLSGSLLLASLAQSDIASGAGGTFGTTGTVAGSTALPLSSQATGSTPITVGANSAISPADATAISPTASAAPITTLDTPLVQHDTTTPIPPSVLLMGSGLLGLIPLRRREACPPA
jgi:hypothetical protein